MSKYVIDDIRIFKVRVRKKMKEKGFTAEMLSVALNVSLRTVYRLINGESRDEERLEKLAEVLETTVEELASIKILDLEDLDSNGEYYTREKLMNSLNYIDEYLLRLSDKQWNEDVRTIGNMYFNHIIANAKDREV